MIVHLKQVETDCPINQRRRLNLKVRINVWSCKSSIPHQEVQENQRNVRLLNLQEDQVWAYCNPICHHLSMKIAVAANLLILSVRNLKQKMLFHIILESTRNIRKERWTLSHKEKSSVSVYTGTWKWSSIPKLPLNLFLPRRNKNHQQMR